MKNGSRQLQIDFTPDVVVQFPEFRDCVRASVYSCGKPLKSIAADLDMSVSELSRKLNDSPTDNVNFPLHRLPELMEATGDLSPLHWLIESFLEDPHAKHQRVVEQISTMLPHLQALLASGDLKRKGK